jgi:hypothetical protein
MMKPSRFGMRTLGKVSAFIVSLSPMSLAEVRRRGTILFLLGSGRREPWARWERPAAPGELRRDALRATTAAIAGSAFSRDRVVAAVFCQTATAAAAQ